MNTIEDLLSIIEEYNEESKYLIKRAYYYADYLHKGQMRQSGEPYISHPLNVAYILANMKADTDTICAALLHDTIEDSKITKEDIENDFNKEIAKLVDGVTKISRMNFSSKLEQNLYNTRKIITSITDDIRIILIKLADRLHNMRTLKFKSEIKQKENAKETLDIFVPIAYLIGAYRIKSELEDLSLQYLEPDTYKRIEEDRHKIVDQKFDNINEMKENISYALSKKGLNHSIIARTKNIYGLYKKGYPTTKITNITDLFALKIMLDTIDNCYITLGVVNQYKPMNGKFKDYIANPKTNKYQALHTTVFGPNDCLVQAQIRTFEMDMIACNGLAAYWNFEKENAKKTMQADLEKSYQFYNLLSELDQNFSNNEEFISHVRDELFARKIYIYNTNGQTYELPIGSTVLDFAYKVDQELGDNTIAAIVNGKTVPANYVLNNKDIVKILTPMEVFNQKPQIRNDFAKTTVAKRRIKELRNKR